MSEATSTQRREGNDDDVEFDKAEESSSPNGLIYDKAYAAAEKFAGTYVGQYATEKVDRILKLIEDTAKWSLPQSSQDKNDTTAPLERPLPWIPFIAMILMLRIIRLSLSVGGLFIGNAPLVPGDVVYFIQTRRRKLRAIRIIGMRDIRRKEQARGQKGGGIVAKLRSLLSIVVCRPGYGRDLVINSATQRSLETDTKNDEKNSKKISRPSKKETTDDDCSDQDLTLDEILNKFGNAPSDDDSDFIPPPGALNDADTSSESTSSATSDGEHEEEDNEVTLTREDAKLESDPHMTNGNRRSQNSLHTTENQVDDNSVIIKENGEQFSKSSRRPIPMPKPHKQEHMPIPIQEIKQEPIESDEDRLSTQQLPQDSSVLKRSTEQQSQHQQQQSVVAREDESFDPNDGSKDTCERTVEKAEKKINGDENSHIINSKSEVFLTPATSTEDLFFSPVGSPNLSGNFGFQPTSILKNPNAVHMERRGPEVIYREDENISKAESTSETVSTSRPSTCHQPGKGNSHYTGKHNKNKFRGKRR